MDGFKKFILKGNLVDVAVGLIMALAFTAVVTAFTAWLTSLLPSSLDNVFSHSTHFGSFMNALISFVILGAVVYFFIVKPYTKAKERFFPAEAAGPTDIELLTEIRDALRARD